jgi:hypothetical protein
VHHTRNKIFFMSWCLKLYVIASNAQAKLNSTDVKFYVWNRHRILHVLYCSLLEPNANCIWHMQNATFEPGLACEQALWVKESLQGSLWWLRAALQLGWHRSINNNQSAQTGNTLQYCKHKPINVELWLYSIYIVFFR